MAARAGRGDPFVSHVMFADDLLLFGDAKVIWCKVMRGKYQRGTEIDVVIAKPTDSHLWQIIVKLWPQ
jgi:S-adenosylmethionine:tRNA-ribosyltransferase-isomerase (queuine synthetase)